MQVKTNKNKRKYFLSLGRTRIDLSPTYFHNGK